MTISKGGRRCAALACAGMMLTALTGCGGDTLPLDAQHGIADQSRLYGMCYLLEERAQDTRDIAAEVQLMKNLGVRTVRQWMHFTHFMSDPETFHEDWQETKDMRTMLSACSEAGIMVIGMNHHNFCTTTKASPTAKPFARDVSAGSAYVQWLNDYYTSWHTLVTNFPEVTYWEIDNEVNNPDFMTDGAGKGQSSYNVREMAQIATDMFYYASRAIHDANPDAVTVMGGLTEPSGLGTGNTAAFLQLLYDNIASGEYGYFYGREEASGASTSPDDYFEVVCWHPYMSRFNAEHFVATNNEYYEIVLSNEGKHKKVFFTEIGWDDGDVGEAAHIENLRALFAAVATMPYVETVNIFKMYDNGTLNNWDGSGYQYWGFFHDADPSHVYTQCTKSPDAINIDESGNCITGAPKQIAFVYQELAGGSGDLTLMMKEGTA